MELVLVLVELVELVLVLALVELVLVELVLVLVELVVVELELVLVELVLVELELVLVELVLVELALVPVDVLELVEPLLEPDAPPAPPCPPLPAGLEVGSIQVAMATAPATAAPAHASLCRIRSLPLPSSHRRRTKRRAPRRHLCRPAPSPPGTSPGSDLPTRWQCPLVTKLHDPPRTLKEADTRGGSRRARG